MCNLFTLQVSLDRGEHLTQHQQRARRARMARMSRKRYFSEGHHGEEMPEAHPHFSNRFTVISSSGELMETEEEEEEAEEVILTTYYFFVPRSAVLLRELKILLLLV